MRILATLIIAAAASIATGATMAAPGDPPAASPPTNPPAAAGPPPAAGAPAAPDAADARPLTPADRAADLTALFAQLKSADSDEKAKSIQGRVEQQLLKSGSDTIDLLMSWALQAMNSEDYGTALDILDRVTILKPDYAEGWNKRATVYFAQNEFGKSLIDIQHTLALEPRHFGALSGLGMIMRELGKNDLAMVALRKALEVYPRLDNAKKALDDLEKESGKDI